MSKMSRKKEDKICTTPECGAWSRNASDLLRCKQCGRTQALSRASEPDAISLKEAVKLGWAGDCGDLLCPICVEAENERRKKVQSNWWYWAMAGAAGVGGAVLCQRLLRGEDPFCSRIGVEIAGGTLEQHYWG